MSDFDPSAEDVQPEEGQGDEATEQPPYAEALSRIPEEFRDQVEPVFKDWDAGVTRRFQEASEAKKSWERYADTGVGRYDPEAVQWALQLMETARDKPDELKEWYSQYAEERGLNEAKQEAGAPDFTTYEEYGQDPNQLNSLLEQHLSPLSQQLQEMTAWRQQQEQQAREAEAGKYIDNQMNELKAKYPDDFKDTTETGPEKIIEEFLPYFAETDPMNAVPRAFARYQAIRGGIEKNYASGKLSQPPPPEKGGLVNGAPETMSKEERMAAAINMIRESQRHS